MKRIVVFISINLLLIVIFCSIINENDKPFEKDGVTLAMTLDGKKIETFPDFNTGKYFVDVVCKNANGYWKPVKNDNDEYEWNLTLENVVGKVVCNLDFFTTDKNISSFVSEKTTNEEFSIPVLKTNDSFNTISSNEYGNVTNTSTGAFTFDDSSLKWTQTRTTSGSTTFKFYPSENGFYKICYEIPASASTTNSSSYKNYIQLHKLNTTLATPAYTETTIYSNISNGDTITGCYDYNYVSTSDFIYITGYYYDANITFYAQKSTDYESISSGKRYEGDNPNNYIWFNDEMWRIIGSIPTKVFSDGTTENLVKIIRNDIISGGLYFDTNNNYTWGSNSVYTLLNDYYLNAKDATNTDYCPLGAKCDYGVIGIKNNTFYKNMIKNVYWNSGNTDLELYSDVAFKNELTNRSAQGYIGLMSPSDYGFAVGNGYLESVNKSWLSRYTYEMTLNPNKTYKTWENIVGITWAMRDNISDQTLSIRPVVYLDSSVYVVSGDGTEANPYQIAM